jgi:two-component system OmpR family sensor kinase
LSNLVDNAIRYTPHGGRVDVAVSIENGRAVIRISDSGPGIPLEDRTRVFDRFYRCENAQMWGSGLGLAIVRNIADMHNATVDLGDNIAGKGLTVTVTFSRHAALP